MLWPPLPSDDHALSIRPGTLQKHSGRSLPSLRPRGLDGGRGTRLFQIKAESP